jgi:hypothetical protein
MQAFPMVGPPAADGARIESEADRTFLKTHPGDLPALNPPETRDVVAPEASARLARGERDDGSNLHKDWTQPTR